MMHPQNTLAVGRRKTSVARVILAPGAGAITINKKSFELYFPLEMLRREVMKPLEVTQSAGKYDIRVNVEGGGVSGQAGAVQLSISQALVLLNDEHRPLLRAAGLMTRDPRMVERKKYGQKKARKRFQFSKR
jgi:small subunit ribosomal protein S9